MRFATCLAAFVLATTTVTTQVADACGGYEMISRAPRALVVSTHTGYHHEPMSSTTRSFAILGATEAVKNAKWTRVAPRSYDHAKAASLGKLAAPMTVTLVGPSGITMTTATRHVALADTFLSHDSTFDAIELPATRRDEVGIALVGDHRNAKWHAINWGYTNVQKIDGTDLSFTSSLDNGNVRVNISNGKHHAGTYSGSVSGAVDIDGQLYVVLTDRGVARLVRA